jgi:hypothetical protein
MRIGRGNRSIQEENLHQCHYCMNYGTADSDVIEVSEKPDSSMFRV